MLANSPLGQKSPYIATYTPSLLFQISREGKRAEIGVPNSGTLPFYGVDIWNAFEVSWLNLKGKPLVALAEISVPCESPCIFESKSLKLYLNSFNQSRFASPEAVAQVIAQDLSKIVGAQVQVKIISHQSFPQQRLQEFEGICLDDLDIECEDYQVDPALLHCREGKEVTETLYSHLLKSNCLVTAQPDWGSIMIQYHGQQINHQDLLRYIVSFRNHQEFHEQCVERIFMAIRQRCNPKKLTVYARYTRRGGIDINPFRSTEQDVVAKNMRSCRQ